MPSIIELGTRPSLTPVVVSPTWTIYTDGPPEVYIKLSNGREFRALTSDILAAAATGTKAQRIVKILAAIKSKLDPALFDTTKVTLDFDATAGTITMQIGD